ncbi:hypothetical protein [Streptomyces sp. NPDC093111]|uniref:hypothetical protein n=1 Tax=Streptomyces sp. NPDC093111 TaxID=3154978 RepID=UPI00341B4B24
MLNRIRRAITRTRERHAPKPVSCHPRTVTRLAPAPRGRSTHEYVLAGEDTASILRHSRIATTLDIYAEALDPDVIAAVGQLDRLLRQPAALRRLADSVTDSEILN